MVFTRRPLWRWHISVADIGVKMRQKSGCRLSGINLDSRYDSNGSKVNIESTWPNASP